MVYSLILKLLAVAALGFWLCRRRIINEAVLKFLGDFLIKITIPALIFASLCRNFSFSFRPPWWVFILWSLVIFILAIFISFLLFFWAKKHHLFSESLSLVVFQNSGYLPLNIAFFLLSPFLREKFLVFVFLYLLGYNILIWSIGSFFIFRSQEKFRFSSLFSPPVAAALLAFLVVGIKVNTYIPEPVYSYLFLIGNLSFALSLIFLGASLAKIRINLSLSVLIPLFIASLLKLMFLPLGVLFLLFYFKIGGLLGFFLIVEAAMPAAVSLPLVALWRGKNYEFISQGVLISHILSLFTIPFWLGLYLKEFGL